MAVTTISSQVMTGNRKISISSWASTTKQQQWKSAKISKFSKSVHPSQQPPSAASSSSLPRGHPAFLGASQPSPGPASSLPGASQQSPRGQPAVFQSTSQNGIIHIHLDHVNMFQCTFSFYVICYLYWFGCVSLLFRLLASHFNWSKVATLHTFLFSKAP